jgi:CheY-like chemotaxis protein
MDNNKQDQQSLPVLVIDDVRSARAVISDMLKDMGFESTVEAKNGIEALSVLESTDVQLILCDFMMEGMNGVEFLAQLRESCPDSQPPVIFVSSLGDVSSVEAAMELGAIDYLVKPVSFRKFRRTVEHSLFSREDQGSEQPTGG